MFQYEDNQFIQLYNAEVAYAISLCLYITFTILLLEIPLLRL